MDYILDILIEKKQIGKLHLLESLAEWGGEQFSRNPPQYTKYSTLLFEEYLEKDYFEEYLEKDYFSKEFVALHFKGSLLDLEISVNHKAKKFYDNEIILFLTDLFMLKQFAIFLIREEEYIDEKYEICDKKELYNIILNSLDWTNPKGVLITRKL